MTYRLDHIFINLVCLAMTMLATLCSQIAPCPTGLQRQTARYPVRRTRHPLCPEPFYQSVERDQ